MVICFVCTGNICRSPIAEGMLRSRWDSERNGELRVSSMGVQGLPDAPASSLAVQVCAEHGFDISAHRSRALNYAELDAADLILCMEPMQRDFIRSCFPALADRTGLAAVWPEEARRHGAVEDPIGGSLKTYRKAYDVISGHIDRIIPNIVEAFWPRIRGLQ